ncbi:MAG: serine/threonine-protein kinase [Polyangiales bacterium]
MSKTFDGLIGRTIDGRYRVETVLGEGGMGLVYRVTHTRLNKPLAMKVLRRENTRDPEVIARFRREAESASGIGNQHIVDISDFGTLDDGSTYFVMEYLQGVDLIDAIDVAERMPEERAVRIALQVCRALGAAHDAGIVHRDLKPENVFLVRRDDAEDFVKVLDFGIAKVANGPKRLTRAGEVLGTPHYMSPEQCQGDDVDLRTDIYAMGVLLYEMVTGHVPHDADTMMGILTKQMYEDPIPPKVRATDVSDRLEQVIMRCLEKERERRYQTMQELLADLERVRRGLKPTGPNTVTLAPTRPPRKRRVVAPIYLGGLALAVLALIGTLVMNAVGGHSTESESLSVAPPRPSARTETAIAPATVTSAEVTPAEEEVSAPDPRDDRSVTSVATTPREGVDKARSKTIPRKRRPAAKGSLSRDQAILDPWN